MTWDETRVTLYIGFLLQLVQAKEKYEPTILDILNDNCWRYVFDYVSVEDIIRSERVSRQWQRKVHNYLRGARLCIRSSIYHYGLVVPSVNCRVVNVGPVYYIKFIQKFGPAIVASDCLSEIGLRTLGKNSPDLEELTLLDLQTCKSVSRSLPARLSALRRRAITLRLWKPTYNDNPITETYSNVVLDWNASMYLLHEFE